MSRCIPKGVRGKLGQVKGGFKYWTVCTLRIRQQEKRICSIEQMDKKAY